MKKILSKNQIRKELDKQISNYLESGNSVSKIPKGVGSMHIDEKKISWKSSEKKKNWKYLNDIVNKLEQRKEKKINKPIKKKTPQRKLLYDDFGEPLRWIWTDD